MLTRVYLFLWWKIAGPARGSCLPLYRASQFELLRFELLVGKIFPKRWRSKFNARPVKPRFDAQMETGQEGRKKVDIVIGTKFVVKRRKNCGQNELWLGRKLCNAITGLGITGARSSWLRPSSPCLSSSTIVRNFRPIVAMRSSSLFPSPVSLTLNSLWKKLTTFIRRNNRATLMADWVNSRKWQLKRGCIITRKLREK